MLDLDDVLSEDEADLEELLEDAGGDGHVVLVLVGVPDEDGQIPGCGRTARVVTHSCQWVAHHPVKYQILIEYGPETKSFGASVPGFPVCADANSEQEAIDMTRRAPSWYLE